MVLCAALVWGFGGLRVVALICIVFDFRFWIVLVVWVVAVIGKGFVMMFDWCLGCGCVLWLLG